LPASVAPLSSVRFIVAHTPTLEAIRLSAASLQHRTSNAIVQGESHCHYRQAAS